MPLYNVFDIKFDLTAHLYQRAVPDWEAISRHIFYGCRLNWNADCVTPPVTARSGLLFVRHWRFIKLKHKAVMFCAKTIEIIGSLVPWMIYNIFIYLHYIVYTLFCIYGTRLSAIQNILIFGYYEKLVYINHSIKTPFHNNIVKHTAHAIVLWPTPWRFKSPQLEFRRKMTVTQRKDQAPVPW